MSETWEQVEQGQRELTPFVRIDKSYIYLSTDFVYILRRYPLQHANVFANWDGSKIALDFRPEKLNEKSFPMNHDNNITTIKCGPLIKKFREEWVLYYLLPSQDRRIAPEIDKKTKMWIIDIGKVSKEHFETANIIAFETLRRHYK